MITGRGSRYVCDIHNYPHPRNYAQTESQTENRRYNIIIYVEFKRFHWQVLFVSTVIIITCTYM